MAKQNSTTTRKQVEGNQVEVLKFVDYLVSNMPATALGKGHPLKHLYAIPEPIYAVLRNYVEKLTYMKHQLLM